MFYTFDSQFKRNRIRLLILFFFVFGINCRSNKFPTHEYDSADSRKCFIKNLWDFSKYNDEVKHSWTEDENQNSLSSDSSWTSSGTNAEGSCPSLFDNSSKRSSSVLSSENSESGPVGTDFTRDFYRLVKFESSKSLASSSTKSQTGIEQKIYNCDLLACEDCSIDREQALQSVLKFIAEQQRYCISRLVQDEQRSNFECEIGGTNEGDTNREVTQITQEEDDGYFSKISFDNGNGNEDSVTEDKSFDVEEGISNTFCNDNNKSSTILNCVDYKTLFKTCDNCFQNIENIDSREDNICDKCAECYIDCLSEENTELTTFIAMESATENEQKMSRYVVSSMIQKSCLDTVVEEQEELNANIDHCETSIVSTAELVNFHDRATSKEVIDELNRMIRKGDELNEQHGRTTPPSDVDESYGCSTGWVHVEQDIDFTDPKVSICFAN